MQDIKTSQNLKQLLINIIIPTLILLKGDILPFLTSVSAFLLAISIPLFYGFYDYINSKKRNLFSIIGLINIALTGTIGLLKLDPQWLAVKEAAIPFCLGTGILIAIRLKIPILKPMMTYVLNQDKIYAALDSAHQKDYFHQKMISRSYIIVISFYVSSALNFTLAKYLVVSPAGTPEFNKELGLMTALSFPVIAVPSTLILCLALWLLIRDIQTLTKLSLEDIIKHH